MFAVDPNQFSKMESNAFERGGYLSGHRKTMDLLSKNGPLTPSGQTLKEAVEVIRAQIGVAMKPENVQTIIWLHPEARVLLSFYGARDIEASALLLDAVANYLAGTRWPQVKDEVDLSAFVKNLRVAARFMGFETIEEK